MTFKFKGRKTFGGYILDAIFKPDLSSLNLAYREQELKILEKSRPPESTECSECGRVGIIARCSHRKIFKKCDRPLCEKCAVLCEDGRYSCPKHCV